LGTGKVEEYKGKIKLRKGKRGPNGTTKTKDDVRAEQNKVKKCN